MKKSDKKYIVILGLLILLAVAIKLAEPKEIDWRQSYSFSEKKPFGAFILSDLSSNLFSEGTVSVINSPIFELEDDFSEVSRNWIFINSTFSLDQYETITLRDHANLGDFIFVSAWKIEGAFADTLGIELNKSFPIINPTARSLDSLTQSTLNFTNQSLSNAEGWSFPRTLTNTYFSRYDTTRTTVLGVNNEGKANFIKIDKGDGAFYIHSNPFLFTNYFVKDPAKYDYAFSALSYLPNQDTYWDEYYKEGRLSYNSPMRYVVSDDNLKWAWFIALASALLFLIFRGRRTQRIIPEIPAVKNTSLEFAETIGNLYLNSGSHKDLLTKKVQFFLDYIRTHLHIDTNVLDDKTLTQIALRSSISNKEITELFKHIETLQNKAQISDSEIKRITEQIDKFYKQSQR
tara:strand:- start:50828 stop:52036 length:1209 start_codon:yes stop_codon:yes gene_type:complete